jgi:hypothetical protein
VSAFLFMLHCATLPRLRTGVISSSRRF